MFCTPEADLLVCVSGCVCVWCVNKTMTKSQSRLPFLLQLFGPVLYSPMSCHLKCSTQFVLSRRIEAVSQLRNCLCFSLCHALLTHALVPQWQPAQHSPAAVQLHVQRGVCATLSDSQLSIDSTACLAAALPQSRSVTCELIAKRIAIPMSAQCVCV